MDCGVGDLELFVVKNEYRIMVKKLTTSVDAMNGNVVLKAVKDENSYENDIHKGGFLYGQREED